MLKLYRVEPQSTLYWEAWENGDGSHTVHWGTLGHKGESKAIRSSLFRSAAAAIKAEVERRLSEGYKPIEVDDHRVLMIEYSVQGFGDGLDLDKRHRLEDRMNETLGWTGLGMCDGGSIGSGTMEVCCYVVHFDLAKQVIEADLRDTEFGDFTRIYAEDSSSA
jgi:hypothetical protein